MWWKKKFKPLLVDNKYRIIEAFDYGGIKYLMYDQAFEVPTGRMFAAMAIYSEMEMKCDKEYLDLHVRAMDKLLNDNKKGIQITYIAQLNMNLKERLELIALPDYVYKLASVIFFDETESVYSYDFEYNRKKIEKWRKSPDTLDFFLQRLGTELMPSLKPAEENTDMYFRVAEKIDKIHRDTLLKVLSEKS